MWEDNSNLNNWQKIPNHTQHITWPGRAAPESKSTVNYRCTGDFAQFGFKSFVILDPVEPIVDGPYCFEIMLMEMMLLAACSAQT